MCLNKSMFKTLRGIEENNISHSGRSHVGETMQIEGDLRTAGSIDIAGLINGNIFVSEMTITETGSIRGSIEASNIEINGHVEGKIVADTVIVGKTAVIKGDVFFKNTLKTEEGADIDGYIKKTNSSKSKLADSFIFSKTKDEKKSKDDDKQENVVNKEALA